MAKIKYLTTKEYARIWSKHERSIYNRISEGKLIVIPEPDGGRGRLIPVCDCAENHFPEKSLCITCKRNIEKAEKEKMI